MISTLKDNALRYSLAMNASAMNSAVHAAVAFFSVAGAHAVSDSIPALTLQQGAAVFLLAFGRALLAYLDAHPLSVLQPAIETPATPASTATNQKVNP